MLEDVRRSRDRTGRQIIEDKDQNLILHAQAVSKLRRLKCGRTPYAQKAFAVLRMIRHTFSRITRTDFQILYGAYVRPLLEYANPVVYSGRTKDIIITRPINCNYQ
ncbi:hypothetical protein CLF_102993 [Clonorchis sinensis]|uniref:Pol-related protein n=1 Tax=Clonorchis sinensis TaxID=79923 RepID=G7YNB6_CLOSI|nr:hypothetical protein CLF_102993 [Clonorchis sinensis]